MDTSIFFDQTNSNSENTSNPIQVGIVTNGVKSAKYFIPFFTDDVKEALLYRELLTVIGASIDNVACGVAAGFIEDDAFVIMMIYVAPEYRRRGVGRALFSYLKELLPDNITFRIDIPNYAEDGSEEFLLAMNCENYIPADGMLVAPFSSLAKSVVAKKRNMDEGITVLPFSKCTKDTLVLAENSAIKENAPLPAGGLFDRNIDKDMSFLYMKGNENVAFLVVESGENASYVTGLYSKINNPMVLMSLLQDAIKQGPVIHPDEGHLLYVPYTNMASYRLAKYLIPDLVSAVKSFIYNN